jgi:DNA-binding NarL/FixJ family response regulator
VEAGGEPIRVLIADDDADTRLLLAEVLRGDPALSLVGEAKDAEEAVKLAGEVEADVMILDWVMPGGGGGHAVRLIKAEHPEIAIIALTGMDPTQASYDMMTGGAEAFVAKDAPTERIVEAIHSAARWR